MLSDRGHAADSVHRVRRLLCLRRCLKALCHLRALKSSVRFGPKERGKVGVRGYRSRLLVTNLAEKINFFPYEVFEDLEVLFSAAKNTSKTSYNS